MKKAVLFVLALSAGLALFAQDEKPQLRTPMAVKTRFGLRGGINLADLNSKNASSTAKFTEAESKTSFNAGVFANVPISGMFRFQPEIAFSSQGGKLHGPSGSGNAITYEQDLHYLTLPLNFQLMANKGFFIQTGPQFGYLVSAKIKNATGTGAPVNSDDNKDDFDKLDFSWTGGVGYLSRIGLGIDLRYNLGIANVVADDASTTAPLKGQTWKNSVGQFSLIYHFGANK